MSTALASVGGALPQAISRPGATLAAQVAPFLGWLGTIRGRSLNTVHSYQHDLRMFVAFAESAGVVLPSQVTFNLLEMHFAHRLHRERKKAATVNRARYALGASFKYLRRQGLVTHDPVGDTFSLPQPQRVPRYLTIPEQERILAAFASRTSLAGRRDYAMLACALLTGVRVSELATVRVTDLDLEAGTLRVLGKGNKERECTAVPRLREILRDYLTRTWPSIVGGRYGSPYLFTRVGNHQAGAKGREPLLTRSIYWRLEKQVSPLVGRPVHPHMLRHSFASRLRENGAPLEVIQQALGHPGHLHDADLRAREHPEAQGGHRAVSRREGGPVNAWVAIV